MRSSQISIATIILMISTISWSKTIYVGNTSESSTNQIQEAIDSANNGDIIILSPGTYAGNGNRDINFKGKAITIRGTDPNDSKIVESTIIDCQGKGCGFIFANGEKADSMLEGITIINGKAPKGSGILISECSPKISKCIIRDCGEEAPTYQLGGGIYIFSGNPTITDCTITNNVTFIDGGGIYCENGSPSIINSTIEKNRVSRGNGGGIFYSGSDKPSIINCIIRENSSSSRGNGGGIAITGGQPIINLCSVTKNTGGRGGGLYLFSCNPIVSQCTFTNNYATSSGGIYIGGQGSQNEFTFNLKHCLISGNSANTSGALSSRSCTLNIHNCVVSGNLSLSGIAGGLNLGGYTIADINQCTITGNKALQIPEQKCAGGGISLLMCDVKISNSIIYKNHAIQGAQIAISPSPLDRPTNVTINYCNCSTQEEKDIYQYEGLENLTLTMANNFNADPCFAKEGSWIDENNSNAIWIDGDYHLKSESGRWNSASSVESDSISTSWVKDNVTSPCIDAGDPTSEYKVEISPNGKRVNLGAYGNTEQASLSNN